MTGRRLYDPRLSLAENRARIASGFEGQDDDNAEAVGLLTLLLDLVAAQNETAAAIRAQSRAIADLASTNAALLELLASGAIDGDPVELVEGSTNPREGSRYLDERS